MAGEPVEARIYIQGVALFVVSPDSSPESQEIQVLIPDQEKAEEAGLHTCEHEAVAQFRSLDENGAEKADRRTLDGRRLRIRSDSKEMDLVSNEGSIRGMPQLPEVLKGTVSSGRIDRPIIGNPFEDSRVLTHLTIDRGVLSPAAAFETRYEIPRASAERPISGLFSNTILIELGWVETFELEIAELSSGEVIETIDLAKTRTLYDEAEVWIRNFCNITPNPWFAEPPPFDEAKARGREDGDFVLNYSLLKDLPELVESTLGAGGYLPLPILQTSWQDGDPCGLENRKCAPAQGGRG